MADSRRSSGSFPVFFQISYGSAVQAAEQIRRHPDTPIRFLLKDSSVGGIDDTEVVHSGQGQGPNIAQLGESGELWLLFETKEKIIAFYQPINDKIPDILLPAEVVTVATSDIKWLSVHVQ